MSEIKFSRRGFLDGLATVTAAAAVAPHTASASGRTVITTGQSIIRDNSSLTILTTLKIPKEFADKITSVSPKVKLIQCGSAQELLEKVADADAIYGQFSREAIAAGKKLKWIQYTSAGVEGVLHPELVNSEIVLTNMKGIFAKQIAEHVFAMLLGLTRKIPTYLQQQRQQIWKRHDDPLEVGGWTMGIIGLGGIGTETARRAHAFDMQVIAVDIEPIRKPHFVAELHHPNWLPEMLPQCDVLVTAVPHTPLTFKMLGAEQFNRIKRGAIFIGVSRGKVVDEPQLVRALQEGKLSGAGLDVTFQEPLPKESELWNMENVIITSHSAAQSRQHRERRMLELLAENARRFIAGEPLLNQVDKRKGY